MGNGIWKLHARASLREAPDGDGGILLDTFNAAICSCNGTAWTVLKAMQKGAKVHQIVAKVRKDFEVDKNDAERDILAFIRTLRSMDLVDGG